MTLCPHKRQKAIELIHLLSCVYLKNNPSSIDEFQLSLTNLMVENKFFETYIDKLRESFEKGASLGNKNIFYSDSGVVAFSEEDSDKYTKLRQEAFDKLNPQVKQYLRHKQKLEIERKMFVFQKSGISKELHLNSEMTMKK